MKVRETVALLIISCATASLPLQALPQTSASEQQASGHVPVGKKQPHETSDVAQAKPNKKHRKIVKKCWFTSKKASTPSYPVKSIGARGTTIAMADETIWAVSPRFGDIAAQWPESSHIVIQPNKHWFSWLSSYDFRLYNLSTGDVVEADLSQGPMTKYAIYIQTIDKKLGILTLTNGSKWSVDGEEGLKQIAGWRNGQAVLFGENSGWFGLPYILVNINENDYAPVALHSSY